MASIVDISTESVQNFITTLLTDATKGGNDFIAASLELLKDMAKIGGDLDAKDERQNNAFWAICKASMIRSGTRKDADAVMPLLQAILDGGAKLDQHFSQEGNKTPLQMFAFSGAVECATLLLAKGVAVDELDGQGWTALVVALSPNGPASGRNHPMARLLVTNHKANVNHATAQGLTPLALAMQCEDIESVRLLVAAGANITQRCAMGFSPIVWGLIGSLKAEDNVTRECVQFLLTASSHRGSQTYSECEGDVSCFYFSKLLASLRKTQLILASGGTNGADEVASSLLTKLVELLPNAGSVGDADGNKIAVAIDSAMPAIFAKIWKLPPNIPPEVRSQIATLNLTQLVNLCLAASSPVERSQLRILMTGPFGPAGRPDKPPFLVPYELAMSLWKQPGSDQNSTISVAFISGLYKDYKELIVDVLASKFSAAMPSPSGLELISNRLRVSQRSDIDSVSKVTQLVCSSSAESPSSGYWTQQLASDTYRIDCTTQSLSDIAIENTASNIFEDDLLVVLPDLVHQARQQQQGTGAGDLATMVARIAGTLKRISERKRKGLVIVVGECPPTEAFAAASEADDDDSEMPALLDADEAGPSSASTDAVSAAVEASPTTEGPRLHLLQSPFKTVAGDMFDQALFALSANNYEIKSRHPIHNFIFEKNEIVIWGSRDQL